MILAAGRGDRLRPITDKLPKPLVTVDGCSLLERHLHRLSAAGVDRVVINLGHHGEQIVARVGSGRDFGLHVAYSPEYDAILETGGGLQRALPMLGDEPFWVLNGDIYTDLKLSAPCLNPDDLGHLVLVPRPEHRERGDFGLIDGRVRNVDDPDLTFSGIACYRPEFVAGRKPGRFSLAPLLREAAERDRLSGEVYRGEWEDVGTPERLAALNRRLESV